MIGIISRIAISLLLAEGYKLPLVYRLMFK
jgi:hypothetical protein